MIPFELLFVSFSHLTIVLDLVQVPSVRLREVGQHMNHSWRFGFMNIEFADRPKDTELPRNSNWQTPGPIPRPKGIKITYEKICC